MIIQGDNLVVNGTSVDGTKLTNHDLISVTSVGNAAVGGTIPNGVDSTFTYLMSSSVAMLGKPTEGGFYKNAYYDGTTYRRINAGAAQRIYMSTDGNIGIEGALTDVAGSALTFSSLLNISKEGYISTPKQPAWNVQSILSEGSTPGASGSFGSGYVTSVAGLGVQGVTLSGANSSSVLRATVAVGGWYLIGMKRHVFFDASSQWTEYRLLVNGVSTSSGHQGHTAGTHYETQMHTTIVKLNANDYVEYGDNGGTQFRLHGPSNAFGYLIG